MAQQPSVLVVLGTNAWRPWIDAFLESSRYRVEVLRPGNGEPHAAVRKRRGGYSAVVFLSRHESLRSDLCAAEPLAGLGVRSIVHQPEEVVRLAFDKRLMAQRATEVPGIEPIPELTPVQAQAYLEQDDSRIVVAKPVDGTEGRGLTLFRHAGDLLTTGQRLYEGGYLFQPFLPGEEYSINGVWFDGNCNLYPPVSKGRVTESGVHPILRSRTCPAPLICEPEWQGLQKACVEYMAPYNASGPVELEFIRQGERFYLLDVNPRVPATLRLTAMTSVSYPLVDLLAAACGVGTLGREVVARQHALEWPLTRELPPETRAKLEARRDLWISTRVTVAAPDAKSLAERAEETRRTLDELDG